MKSRGLKRNTANGQIDIGIRAFGGLLVKVFAATISLVLSVLLARAMPVESFGAFMWGFTLIQLLAVLSRFGLDQTLIRVSAQSDINDDARRSRWLAHAIVISILCSAVVMTSLHVGLDYVSDLLTTKQKATLQSLLPALVLLPVASILASYIQGANLVLRALLIQNVVAPALLLAYVSSTSVIDIGDAGRAFGLGCGVAVLLGARWAWQKGARFIFAYSASRTIRILRVCTPLWVTAIGTQVVLWAPLIIFGFVAGGSGDVGIFSASQRLGLVSSLLLVGINAALAPKIAILYHLGSSRELALTVRFFGRILVLLGIAITTITFAAAEVLMRLFGEEYIGGALFLKIIVLAQFVNLSCGSVGYLLSMTGNEKALMKNLVLAASICVALSLTTIPVYGGLGAAVSIAVGLITQNILCVVSVKKELGINTLTVVFAPRDSLS